MDRVITDAEFWVAVRNKKKGGDGIFRCMLGMLHARQSRLQAPGMTTSKEEHTIVDFSRKTRDVLESIALTAEKKKADLQMEDRYTNMQRVVEEKVEPNKSLAYVDGMLPQRVAPITLRVLQHIMLYAVPVYQLRYCMPAMSMSWNTSCFIDSASKQILTFGAGQGVKVPQHLLCRGCIAGEGFFALLTDKDEVWSSGGLRIYSNAAKGPTKLGKDDAMVGIADKTLLLVGHGQRLATVTHAFTVRPLSATSNPTRSVLPSRNVRFLDLGWGEEYYMVGTDSLLYKTTASKKAIGTPRRVMPMSQTAVSRISSGTGFLLIINDHGMLITYGRNTKGQLGIGCNLDFRRRLCHHEDLQHHFFTQVAAGDCHSLALSSDGTVYGCGSNESGQLGLGPSVRGLYRFAPIPLKARCVAIAAGPAGSMFVCEDHAVYTCGLNDHLQLGVNSEQKVVYELMRVEILPAGVESVILEFGGFARGKGGARANQRGPITTPKGGSSAVESSVAESRRFGALPSLNDSTSVDYGRQPQLHKSTEPSRTLTSAELIQPHPTDLHEEPLVISVAGGGNGTHDEENIVIHTVTDGEDVLMSAETRAPGNTHNGVRPTKANDTKCGCCCVM